MPSTDTNRAWNFMVFHMAAIPENTFQKKTVDPKNQQKKKHLVQDLNSCPTWIGSDYSNRFTGRKILLQGIGCGRACTGKGDVASSTSMKLWFGLTPPCETGCGACRMRIPLRTRQETGQATSRVMPILDMKRWYTTAEGSCGMWVRWTSYNSTS